MTQQGPKTVTLPQELRQQISQAAQDQDRSLASFLRIAVQRALDEGMIAQDALPKDHKRTSPRGVVSIGAARHDRVKEATQKHGVGIRAFVRLAVDRLLADVETDPSLLQEAASPPRDTSIVTWLPDARPDLHKRSLAAAEEQRVTHSAYLRAAAFREMARIQEDQA